MKVFRGVGVGLLLASLVCNTQRAEAQYVGLPWVDVWDSTDPDNFVLVGQIQTIQTAQTGKQHYRYGQLPCRASGQPSDVNTASRNANLWVHESTIDGDVTFGFIFGNCRTSFANTAKLNFRIVDSDTNPFVSQSDDPGEARETPAGSNAYLGTFRYNGANTDGIAVSGLSGAWTIIVDNVDFGSILDWYAANGSASGFGDDLALTLGSEYRLTPAGNPPSGKPVVFSLFVDAGDDVTVFSGESTVLGGDPTASDGVEPYSYSWSPGDNLDDASAANPTFTAFALGDYDLTVSVDDQNSTESDDVTVTVVAYPVLIDIKPGSDRNPINLKSKGVIPVAILTTDDFDATQVDPATVRFGAGEAEEAHGKGHIEDVDGDGDDDLVVHFATQDSGIAAGDVAAGLTGQTFAGRVIAGSDVIDTGVGKGKAKKLSTGAEAASWGQVKQLQKK